MNKITVDEKQIVETYQQFKSLKKTATALDMSMGTIRRVLNENHVLKNASRSYACNEDYFENIDTEGKAYLLGYLYADGCVTSNKNRKRVKLKLHKKDKEILYFFNKEIEGNYPIKEERKTNCWSLSIDCSKMVQDLIKQGCVCKKSLILTFPQNFPHNLLHHFIRGFFDGDGCISVKKSNLDPRISFVSSKYFLKDLKKVFKKICEIGNPKLKPSGRAFEICYGGRYQIQRTGTFLYNQSTIYLKRKKDLFDLCNPVIPYTNKVFCDDCLNILPFLPDNSIDLVITSPPYNLSIEYDYCKDNQPYIQYLKWLKIIFHQIYRCLKIGGRCVIIIGDKNNGKIATHSDICSFMEHELKFLPLSTIIWKKNNVVNRQSWGTFASPLSPSFPTAHEYILIFSKKSRKLMGNFETDLTKEEFINWSLAMWDLPKDSYKDCSYLIKNRIHPAPMPEDLAIRCIKMLSWVGAVVLDPFMGTGTVPIACKKLNRKYIGIEMSPDYVKFAEERLRNVMIPYTIFE